MGLYPEPLNIPKNKDIRLKSPVDRLRQDILGSGIYLVVTASIIPNFIQLSSWPLWFARVLKRQNPDLLNGNADNKSLKSCPAKL